MDGATGTLSYYAHLSRSLPESTFQFDGDGEKLSTNARYIGQHVRLARPGVAVHINAFNFPAWGAFEKIACAILAGMPVVTKPATATAWLTYEMIKEVVDANILPEGVLSFVAGPAGDLLQHLGPQDVVAFTGSADTAATLRQTAAMLHESTRFNAEADIAQHCIPRRHGRSWLAIGTGTHRRCLRRAYGGVVRVRIFSRVFWRAFHS